MPFDDASGSSAPPAFGTFRVLHQTGSGVVGPVFRAWDQQRDRLVTVKAFKLDLLPQQVTGVADALRQLAATPSPHPALVQLVDAGFEGTTPYLVMECITGETLDIALRMLASAPLGRAIEMLRPFAEAVDATWPTLGGHGALHPRDLFIVDSADEIRLTGAGIVAALRSAGVDMPPRRPYAAPERGNADWDQRADVYSVAAIAHELLTRRRPAGPHEQDGVFAPEITAPQRVAIRKVLARGLAERPEDRFATATALIDALAAVQVETQSALPFAAAAEPESAPIPDVTAAIAAAEFVTPPLATEAEPFVATEAEPFVATEAEPFAVTEPDSIAAPVLEIALPVEELHVEVGLDAALAEPALADLDDLDEVDADTPDTPVIPPAPWRPVDSPMPLASSTLFASGATSPVSAESKRRIGFALVLTAGVLAGGALMYGIFHRRNAPVSGAATTAPARPGDTEVKIGSGASAPRSGDTTVPVTPPGASAPRAPQTPAPARPLPRGSNDATPVTSVSGQLVVRSSPAGAMVTIDGRFAGDTPLTVRDLSIGSHVVQVARPGYVPQVERVALTRASPARTMTMTLAPGLSQTADVPPSPTAPVARQSPNPAIPALGAIDVDVQPRGARVSIDGERRGVSPMRISELKPGVHTVTIEFDGYRPATTSVTVEAGKRATVKVTLVAIRKP